MRSEDEYFTLHFNVTGADPMAFVELLDAQDKVVRKRRIDKGMADFYFLNPGKYGARLINDTNGNGEWDTGDYAKGQQPEAVYYYPNILEYKALWDTTQNWDIHATPVDKQKPDELKKQKPVEVQVVHHMLSRLESIVLCFTLCIGRKCKTPYKQCY